MLTQSSNFLFFFLWSINTWHICIIVWWTASWLSAFTFWRILRSWFLPAEYWLTKFAFKGRIASPIRWLPSSTTAYFWAHVLDGSNITILGLCVWHFLHECSPTYLTQPRHGFSTNWSSPFEMVIGSKWTIVLHFKRLLSNGGSGTSWLNIKTMLCLEPTVSTVWFVVGTFYIVIKVDSVEWLLVTGIVVHWFPCWRFRRLTQSAKSVGLSFWWRAYLSNLSR